MSLISIALSSVPDEACFICQYIIISDIDYTSTFSFVIKERIMDTLHLNGRMLGGGL